MLVRNNLLICDTSDGVDYSANLRPYKFSIGAPVFVLAHYAVTKHLDAAVAAQLAQGYLAHLTIDGENERPQVRQLLPFNARGSHAGPSCWYQDGKRYDGLNGYSVGIEIANPGPLVKGDDGKLRTVYGKTWDESDVIEARHRNGGPYKYWAKYTKTEIDLFVKVCSALAKAYPVKAILGHDEVAPARKIDPGPAFPMTEVRERVWQSLKQ